jgi:hypothetical protein
LKLKAIDSDQIKTAKEVDNCSLEEPVFMTVGGMRYFAAFELSVFLLEIVAFTG